MIKITNTKLFKTGRWRSMPKLVRIMKTKCFDLRNSGLRYADLSFANLTGADLRGANLYCADLSYADLRCADLRNANLFGASLDNANLEGASLHWADLTGATLDDANGLKKLVGYRQGDIVYKKIDMSNNGYHWRLGRNDLRIGEVFANDERVLCSYPGFHFASKEWCEEHYGGRPFLAKIRIPEDAEINEPWASDDKASASAIEILEVTDKKGNDVSELFRDAADGRGGRNGSQ